MTVSPFRTSLLFSILLSGSVFTAATLPLAMFRSQPVQVQVQNKTVFDSELNAISNPYLWLTGGFSAVLGIGTLALSGWRLSANKLEKDREKAAEMEQKLQASKTELERVSFSSARLGAQGLDSFLEAQLPQIPQTMTAPKYPAAVDVSDAPEAESNQISVIKTALDSVEKTTKENPSTASTAHLKTPAHNLAAADTRSILELVMAGLHSRHPQNTVGTKEAAISGMNGSNARPQHLSVVNPTNNSANEVSPLSQQFQETDSRHQLESVLHQLQNLAAHVEDLQKGGKNGVIL